MKKYLTISFRTTAIDEIDTDPTKETAKTVLRKYTLLGGEQWSRCYKETSHEKIHDTRIDAIRHLLDLAERKKRAAEQNFREAERDTAILQQQLNDELRNNNQLEP